MENCNHELVFVQECTKCGKTFDTIPANTDWEVLEKLEADTLRFMVVDLQNAAGRHYEEARRLSAENNELLSLEKQYSSKLGRLAELCSIVVPWMIDNHGSGACVTDEIASAADEIMDYVDAVRP